MSFIIYDLAFLVVFTLAVVIFLYIKRRNLKRQGLLYLYRTKIGIKIIDYVSKKYAKILKPMQYLVILCGYILMIAGIYFVIKFSYNYMLSPTIARELKVPILTPLIPYLPELLKLDFLPSFPFTYWIIIIALIAIPHEFAHGIFARLNKIRVFSTGFGFLGPFLAAFVEPDEKKMEKSKKVPQLAILASGTFANIIMGILFAIIMILLFLTLFTPAGINFNIYSFDLLESNKITITNSTPFYYTSNVYPLLQNISFITISSNNKTYYIEPNLLKKASASNNSLVQAFEDTPAFNSRISGSITYVNSQKVTSPESFRNIISQYKPGDSITITTIYHKNPRDSVGETKDYTIKLAERNGSPYLGIGLLPMSSDTLMGKLYSYFNYIKDPAIYYSSRLGNFGVFIYNLFWWLIFASISVALINMLPATIFDGGRFFYLTIAGITGNNEIGKKAFKLSTLFFLFLIGLLMLKWVFAFF